MRTFRAWIDERGSNEDRNHPRTVWCRSGRCGHLRMVDLERNDYRIVVRFTRRRRPFYFAVTAFFRPHRGTILLRVGRKL